jgi:predicted Zn-ribbon and HTH transcriptional regulator
VAAQKTRRQEIIDRLTENEWEFDELRREFGLTVKILEEDLRHIDRSVRAGGRRLTVVPAKCESCGFAFKSTAYHPPGRCPSCRNRRITGPWLHIASIR